MDLGAISALVGSILAVAITTLGVFHKSRLDYIRGTLDAIINAQTARNEDLAEELDKSEARRYILLDYCLVLRMALSDSGTPVPPWPARLLDVQDES